jgi:hypothetical protein
MNIIRIRLGAGQSGNFNLGYTHYMRVYSSNGVKVFAKTEEGDNLILEQGLAYDLKPCEKMYVENKEDKEVYIECFVAQTKVYDSRASVAGSLNVKQLSAVSATNKKFDVTANTRVLELNTGRASAMLTNESENDDVFIKCTNGVDVLGLGIRLKPGQSLTLKNNQPVFADVEAGKSVEVRILEESY